MSLAIKHDERRVSPRYEPAIATVCRIAPQGDHSKPMTGLVWNVSSTGLSMVSATHLKPGEELSATLEAELSGALVSVGLRVVHVTPVTSGDCLIGARFATPLGNEILDMLVTPPM